MDVTLSFVIEFRRYDVVVRAVNVVGPSAWSYPPTVVVASGAPDPPVVTVEKTVVVDNKVRVVCSLYTKHKVNMWRK